MRIIIRAELEMDPNGIDKGLKNPNKNLNRALGCLLGSYTENWAKPRLLGLRLHKSIHQANEQTKLWRRRSKWLKNHTTHNLLSTQRWNVTNERKRNARGKTTATKIITIYNGHAHMYSVHTSTRNWIFSIFYIVCVWVCVQCAFCMSI